MRKSTMTSTHIAQNNMIPLDFQSVESVPDSHVWPELSNEFSDHFSSDDDHEKLSIPVIDFTAPNIVELIGHACESLGIFQLINHGIPTSLLDDVEAQTRRLFALPMEEKVKVLRSPEKGSGYGAPQVTPLFSKFMWHEGFTIIGSPVDHAKELWPHDHELFCDVMENYEEKMKALSYQILLQLLNFLDVSEEELKWESSMAYGVTQMNSYPSCPDPKSAMGLAPHTDSFFFNILHQSHSKGLQIFHDRVGWLTIPPMAGALVVNVGDLLHICSNARFPSVLHRALVNQNQHRVSIVYAYGPPFDSLVGPFAGLRSPCFRSLLMREFLSLRAKHRHETLPMMRI